MAPDGIDHFVRAKIYTQKGLEHASVFKIEYTKTNKIFDIAARVVKKNGKTIELKKSDFKETVASKSSSYEKSFELRYTSFAFPDLEIGDIIEYQWRQSMSQLSNNYYSMPAQLEVPVREFIFNVEGTTSDVNVMWFNLKDAEFKKLTRSRMTLRIKNIPPFRPEPLMPPEKDFRGWIAILFSHPYMRWYSEKEVWQEIGSYLAEDFRLSTKPNGTIHELAAKLAAGAKTPEEKLKAYYDFCQREISNFDWVKSAELIEAKKRRDDAQDHPSANETLRAKSGRPEDIDRVFAALARAGGFDVRVGFNADRDEIQASKGPRSWIFMNRYCVAVKVDGKWVTYSPGEYIVPAGMLSGKDELMDVFICDEKKSWTQMNPVAPANETLLSRKGRFTLDEEGTLDGEIEVTLTGHEAVDQKERWWGDAEADATQEFQKRISDRLPGAEFSDAQWVNLQSHEFPVVHKCKVHIPGYAEVAGSKLVLNANMFVVHETPLFSAETRSFPILFPYAEQIHDDIEIVLPENFVLDGGSAPQNVSDPGAILGATFRVGYKPKIRTIVYSRNMVIGGGQMIEFRAESYPAIKNIFERIKRSDDHVFVLKPKPETADAANRPATGKIASLGAAQ
ncbi:MAG TPA: DUF3857 domain-containing protein [Opitutaceae bacterium]|nr:DUF3857 domain-containing protein [Opitutaceae bacterium]